MDSIEANRGLSTSTPSENTAITLLTPSHNRRSQHALHQPDRRYSILVVRIMKLVKRASVHLRHSWGFLPIATIREEELRSTVFSGNILACRELTCMIATQYFSRRIGDHDKSHRLHRGEPIVRTLCGHQSWMNQCWPDPELPVGGVNGRIATGHW